jgi:hypothetical protein
MDKKTARLPDGTEETDVLESIDCLLPLLQQLAAQRPKHPDRLVQKLTQQEQTIEKMKVDQAALEKQVAALTAERDEQKAKQCALEQLVAEKDKERQATEMSRAALAKQLSAPKDNHFSSERRAPNRIRIPVEGDSVEDMYSFRRIRRDSVEDMYAFRRIRRDDYSFPYIGRFE